jgi:hypothetical protein
MLYICMYVSTKALFFSYIGSKTWRQYYDFLFYSVVHGRRFSEVEESIFVLKTH